MARKVLVIEDDPVCLEMLSTVVRLMGDQPLQAADGSVGLQTALDQAPDAIICDLNLPSVHGHEIVRQLRAHPTLGRVPIVGVSASSLPSDRDAAIQVGFDDVLPKPIRALQFKEWLTRFLDLRA